MGRSSRLAERCSRRSPRATAADHVAIWMPLAMGASALAATILIRALAVAATVNFIRREVRVGRAGAGFWSDVLIVVAAISFAFAAHLVEIAVWAVRFLVCGEFRSFAMARYHSAVNYTTLGRASPRSRINDGMSRRRRSGACSTMPPRGVSRFGSAVGEQLMRGGLPSRRLSRRRPKLRVAREMIGGDTDSDARLARRNVLRALGA